MNKLFSPSPLWPTAGLTFIRLAVGFFMIYHGWEIFNEEKMNEYLRWDVFKNSQERKILVYVGKAAELISGLLLFVGLFTRVASMLMAGTMLYVSIFVGHGKIWYEDQHPFLFVLLGFVSFFTGGGKWSIDNLLFNKTQNRKK